MKTIIQSKNGFFLNGLFFQPFRELGDGGVSLFRVTAFDERVE